MTAATENSRRETVWGDSRVIIANLTWNNNYTYDSLYSKLEAYWFVPTTNASYGLTESSGTLTLVSGGSLTGILVAIVAGG